MRDRDVRKAVRSELDARHEGDLNTRIVEEMGGGPAPFASTLLSSTVNCGDMN
jgi:hypothetical protein